jgi:hypothetical protein
MKDVHEKKFQRLELNLVRQKMRRFCKKWPV